MDTKKKSYEYEIFMGKKKIWHGFNLKENFENLTKKYHTRKLAIRWIGKGGTLIA